MRSSLLNLSNGAARRRLAAMLCLGAILVLATSPSAMAQLRQRRGGKGASADPAPPAQEKAPVGPPMSKAQAIIALIQALAVNQSDAARETLEQIVLGKMKFGAHNKQAAETALVFLAMRPSPDGGAYLLKLLTEPDDKIRPGDKDYPAAAVRIDAVRVASRVGSPELRIGLAKAYDGASPEIRAVIETALTKPSPANFAAQVVLLRSRALSTAGRATLRKLILDQNASALKQALKLADASAKAPAAAVAGADPLGVLGKSTGAGTAPAGAAPAGAPPVGGFSGLGLGARNPGAAPASTPAASNANANPVTLILEAREKEIDSKPVDSAAVARELWQNEFVESLSAQLATEKSSPQQVLTAIGSMPLKAARERMRDYLLQKSPQDIGQLEKPTPAAPAAGGGGPAAGLGRGGLGMGGLGMGSGRGAAGGPAALSTPQGPAFLVGGDWLDPGTVVVLKSLAYKDRPKGKRRPSPPPASGKRSPTAEKRAQELAEKQKMAEAEYEWRDAIERFVSHWDDRLSAVAEKHEDAASDTDKAADSKDKAAAKGKADSKKGDQADAAKAGPTKPQKDSEPGTKKTARASESKLAESKGKGSGSAPTPAVPVPFALRPNERITKEFHLRWPDDLPASLSGSVSEPLVVHYLQLEASDDMNRTATFYRGALPRVSGVKPHSETHDLPDCKWVDLLQRDPNSQRTRSLDVLITRQPGDPEAKKSRNEDLTIQVLMVEVETFVPDAKPAEKGEKAEKKEQAKADRP
jgi:hypothetical protein